jgi:hypothetical protein
MKSPDEWLVVDPYALLLVVNLVEAVNNLEDLLNEQPQQLCEIKDMVWERLKLADPLDELVIADVPKRFWLYYYLLEIYNSIVQELEDKSCEEEAGPDYKDGLLYLAQVEQLLKTLQVQWWREVRMHDTVVMTTLEQLVLVRDEAGQICIAVVTSPQSSSLRYAGLALEPKAVPLFNRQEDDDSDDLDDYVRVVSASASRGAGFRASEPSPHSADEEFIDWDREFEGLEGNK